MIISAVRESSFAVWEPRLRALCDDIRSATRRALLGAVAAEDLSRVARPHGQGAGDVTFALDLPSEELCTNWLVQQARAGPLSLLTEDSGWRHMGPGPAPGTEPVSLASFDHGGPRIAIDPVDGTRNLMADLRSAWTVISFAPPGPGKPRLTELEGGLVNEIPGSLARAARCIAGTAGGPCRIEIRDLASGALEHSAELRADASARVDQGYFPIFRYMPDLRPRTAELEAAFFARLALHERAEVRSCFDDQYISNAAHMVLLGLGTYRFVADVRAHLAEERGAPTITSKPYDVAGAIVCARAAGCVVTAPNGTPLDFPIDAATPVGFVGYHNEATRRRLEPHWLAALG